MHLHKQTLFNCQIWHLSILNTTKVSYHCYITVTELLTTLDIIIPDGDYGMTSVKTQILCMP